MGPASTGSNTSSSTARSPDYNGGLLKMPARNTVLSKSINTTTGQTGDSPSRKCDWIDCPICPTSTECKVEEVLYPGGKVGIPQSLVARDEMAPCENSRPLRQVASKTSAPRSSESVDGRADKRRAWQKPSARNRRSDWIERPVCEQHEFVPTTAVRSKTKGRKSSESKEGRLDARERFYETATLLGLVRRW
ncbi:hypothetical protein DAEQUDRAFT_92710 [Daedalea quercina L-15889]|uniref:Uncharacterized protein n=1 Tax=Daedalea quercina L-15889 TaxID=1314783 RepID=A0A165S8Y0_9APHY|nr:hypothetical protein DAEQUDRAFT_92710 [Daedalea quercina L-15889]